MRTPTALIAALALAACSGHPETRHADVSSGAVPPPIDLEGSAYEAAARVQLPEVPPGEWESLHNVFRLSDTIISGGEPLDRAAFERLASWGVKTILSVDGKVPNAEVAAELGMRTVHVPIRYNGIDAGEILRIAKTFRELEAPFFVHCFHGRHRGPAAAAVGRVVLDGLPRDRAIAEMRQWCSTSSKYEGLYATVAVATLPSAEQTEAYGFDFSSAHSFTGMRAVMVELARKWDELEAAQARGWSLDPEHPDVVPTEEARQVQRLFEAVADMGAASSWQDDFRAWLDTSRVQSQLLTRALEEGGHDAADAAFEAVDTSCVSCHAAYRNR